MADSLTWFSDSIGQQTYIETGDPKLRKLLLRILIKGPTKVLEISPERDNMQDALDYCDNMVIHTITLVSAGL